MRCLDKQVYWQLVNHSFLEVLSALPIIMYLSIFVFLRVLLIFCSRRRPQYICEKGSHLLFNRKVKGLKAAHVQAVRREPTRTHLPSRSAKLSLAPLLGSDLVFFVLLQIDHILISGLIKPLYATIEPCLAYLLCVLHSIIFLFRNVQIAVFVCSCSNFPSFFSSPFFCE